MRARMMTVNTGCAQEHNSDERSPRRSRHDAPLDLENAGTVAADGCINR
jgi:hypothetical protein